MSKHSNRRIVQRALENDWAMEPGYLQNVCDFLTRRVNGESIDASQFGNGQAAGDEDRPQIIDGVGLLPLSGVMAPRMNLLTQISGGTSTQIWGQEFNELVADPKVRTVFTEFDSPGGVVVGTEELRQIIFNARGQGTRLVAVIRHQMASAAYYVGSAFDEIIATPSSFAGDIGVYTILRVPSGERAEDMNQRFQVFRAGDLKAAGNPFEALTEPRRQAIQQRIDTQYAQFVSSVAENRGVDRRTVIERFGNGTSFIASEARDRGLIDGIRQFDDALAQERDRARGRSSVSIVAAWSPAEQNLYQAAAAANNERDPIMLSQRVRAALVAARLIDENTDDGLAMAAVGAFAGRAGLELEPLLADENALIQALQPVAVTAEPSVAEPAAAGAPPAAAPSGSDPTITAAAAPDSIVWGEPAAAAAAPASQPADGQTPEQLAATMAQNRLRDLTARGSLMNVPREWIDQACGSDLSVEQITSQWVERLEQQNQRLQTPIRTIDSEDDKINQGLFVALCDRMECMEHVQVPAYARDLLEMRMVDMGRLQLRQAGQRVTYNDEDMAEAWLGLNPNKRRSSSALSRRGINHHGQTMAAGGPANWNQPGDHPHVLAALANKIMDDAIEIAENTYTIWTRRLEDATTLQASMMFAQGAFDQLSTIIADEDLPDFELDSELQSWIKVDRYGNKTGLTATMVANETMGAWAQQLESMGTAHENTLNGLCVAVVANNPIMPGDNQALYSAAHGNLITGAGVGPPSDNTASAMRTAHRLQKGVKNKNRIRSPMRIALCPPNQEQAAIQTFETPRLQVRSPQTDSDVNTVIGTVRVVVENDLHDYDQFAWYTFAEPRRRRAIVHRFQRGYGRGGRRSSWFKDSNKTRYFDIEGRFAAAPQSHRGTVKNPATN